MESENPLMESWVEICRQDPLEHELRYGIWFITPYFCIPFEIIIDLWASISALDNIFRVYFGKLQTPVYTTMTIITRQYRYNTNIPSASTTSNFKVNNHLGSRWHPGYRRPRKPRAVSEVCDIQTSLPSGPTSSWRETIWTRKYSYKVQPINHWYKLMMHNQPSHRDHS